MPESQTEKSKSFVKRNAVPIATTVFLASLLAVNVKFRAADHAAYVEALKTNSDAVAAAFSQTVELVGEALNGSK